MNNELTSFNPQGASLLEMRADSARYPRIKNMPREQAVLGMSKIVSQAFLYRGQAADPTNIQFISSALVQELLEDVKYGAAYLSLAESQVVVKRAVLGGSDMFGIAVASLYKVIMDYVKGEGHLNQVKVQTSRREAADRAFKSSGLNPMLQAYAGEFLRQQQSKKQ